MLSCHILPI